MQRRDFLKNAGVLAACTALGPSACTSFDMGGSGGERVLKGFIVSDAHFGWEHVQQPAPEEQIRAMETIVARFPDLDLFIDTGDAHHAIADQKKGDLARGLWTDIIPGLANPVPFMYIAGNHEIMPVQGLDPELRCNQLGSVSARPYYSFDLKGIHFVSLPELEHAVFVNKESMEWLALDLAVNRDKTVVLLSHNHIKGTTFDLKCSTANTGINGYRGLVNSEELIAVMERYPNVIAWLHGHNHNFEVVEKMNRLFVSNGRIGGFIPPDIWGDMGQGHLGGVYFELRPEGMAVRCYSASEDRFFDEIGSPGLSGKLAVATTINPHKAPAYSYGVGGARDGERLPVVHHHAGIGGVELFVTGAADALINDDPDFSLFAKRENTVLGNQWILPAASVGYPEYFEKTNDTWEWLDPGIRILAQEKADAVVDVCIPHYQYGPFVYYRIAPGRRYRAVLDLKSQAGGQALQLEFITFDRQGRKLAAETGPKWALEPGSQTLTADVEVPEYANQKTIYSDPASDDVLQLMIKAHFSGLKAGVDLMFFGLTMSDGEGVTRDISVAVDGQRIERKGELLLEKVARYKLDAPKAPRSVVEVGAGGNGRLTWLVRQNAVDWQVRNAPVADHGEWLEIGPLRNTWGTQREVVVVPAVASDEPFVHRVLGAEGCRIWPLGRGNRRLKVEVLGLLGGGPAQVEILTGRTPSEVIGGHGRELENGKLTIRFNEPGIATVNFA